MSDYLAHLVQRSRGHQPALRPPAQTVLARWEAPAQLPDELDTEAVARQAGPLRPRSGDEPTGGRRLQPPEPIREQPGDSSDAPDPPEPPAVAVSDGERQAVAPTQPAAPQAGSVGRAAQPPSPVRGPASPVATEPANPVQQTVEAVATKPIRPPAQPMAPPERPPAAPSVVAHRPAQAPPAALPPAEAPPATVRPIRHRRAGHPPVAAPASPADVAPLAHLTEPAPIHVSIGRIEVRAVLPPAPAPRHAEPPGPQRPPLSLDDYLRERSGRPR